MATGSTPAIPPIPGLKDISFDTSDTIFDIPDIPASVVIIGGGVIGLELACIFQSLQSKVTIIEAAPSIIPQEDEEASKSARKRTQEKGHPYRKENHCDRGDGKRRARRFMQQMIKGRRTSLQRKDC
ncbi:FAD-dependent oxidoreductase [Bacillus sp. SL00103]